MAEHHAPQRILVPLDGSGFSLAALPWLRTVAGATTEIQLLRVVHAPLSPHELDSIGTSTFDDIRRRHIDTACDELKHVAAELDDLSDRITRIVRVGTPADEILRVAQAHGAELIVMATHGRGAIGRLLIGSVADRVAQASMVPVMLIRPNNEEEPLTAFEMASCHRLVVPLDGSDRARSALPVAERLARQLDIGIHLVRVVPSREVMLSGRDAAETGALYQRLVFSMPMMEHPEGEEAYFEEYTRTIADALDAEAGHLRSAGIDATSELLIGPTAPSIIDALAADDAIVMTSHGAGGVRRWLIGSVADKLIHMASATIVLVPDADRRPSASPDDEDEPQAPEVICAD